MAAMEYSWPSTNSVSGICEVIPFTSIPRPITAQPDGHGVLKTRPSTRARPPCRRGLGAQGARGLRWESAPNPLPRRGRHGPAGWRARHPISCPDIVYSRRRRLSIGTLTRETILPSFCSEGERLGGHGASPLVVVRRGEASATRGLTAERARRGCLPLAAKKRKYTWRPTARFKTRAGCAP